MTDSNPSNDQTLQELTGTGITLLGVLVSVGVTIATAVTGAWWIRAFAGACTTIVLVAIVKASTRTGRGPVARLARWVIASEQE